MSGNIDVELDSVDTETGKNLTVYLSGALGSDELYLEVGSYCVELSAKKLTAAISYVDFND